MNLNQLARKRTGRRCALTEDEFVVVDSDLYWFAFVEVAFQDFLGERIFQEAFDRAAHWTGAVSRVVTFLDQEVFRLLVEIQDEILALEPFHDLLDLEF